MNRKPAECLGAYTTKRELVVGAARGCLDTHDSGACGITHDVVDVDIEVVVTMVVEVMGWGGVVVVVMVVVAKMDVVMEVCG